MSITTERSRFGKIFNPSGTTIKTGFLDTALAVGDSSQPPTQKAAPAVSYPYRKPLYFLALLFIVLGIGGLDLFDLFGSQLVNWVCTMVLMLGSFLLIGYALTNRLIGILIDERNKISLSRLQLVLWTILILSALVVAALYNLGHNQPQPLDIGIPQQLWLLMGISVTSLVGSPLIRATKESKQANNQDVARTSQMLLAKAVDPGKLTLAGQIVTADSNSEASWSDMFSGEEVGNAAQVDLGKVQMFYFTLIVVLVYGLILSNMFGQNKVVSAFPELDASVLALLGISHATYLINKAVPHSQ